MQKTNWLRLGGLSAMALLVGSLGVIACGGDDDEPGGNTDNTSSGAPGASSGDPGSSSGDPGSSSGDPVPTPARAALAVVHGSIELGAVKICYATNPDQTPEVGQAVAPLKPLPESPTGLIPGSGGILPNTGTDLETIHILPYLIKVSALADFPEATCDELLNSDGANKLDAADYYVLDPIERGTLEAENTYLLIATGTAAAPKANVYKLDTTTEVEDGKIGVQFISGSTYLTQGAAPFLDRPGTPTEEGPAGADRISEWIAGETKVAPLAEISDLHKTDAFTADTALGAVISGGDLGDIPILNRLPAAGDPPVPGNLIPIQQWVALSDPGEGQGAGAESLYFKEGRSFTFVLLGNPLAPSTGNAQVDAFLKPHWIAFPNKPKVPGLNL